MPKTDVLAIGLGPANLSLLALRHGSNACSNLGEFLVLERNTTFQWHPHQLFRNALMQNSFVRDLVTLVDPTNRFSFLAFLKTHGRLLQFLNAGIFFPDRAEFIAYFREVADELSAAIRYDVEVYAIAFDRSLDRLVVSARSSGRTIEFLTSHLIIGIGAKPRIPGFDPEGVHVSNFLQSGIDTAGRHIAVVGSGQSAAELVDYLINSVPQPSRISWISASLNFDTLVTSNFAREIYSPGYGEDFYFGLDRVERASRAKHDQLAESGISPSLAESLARDIYRMRYVSSLDCDVTLIPGARVVGSETVAEGAKSLTLSFADGQESQVVLADEVVYCTGFDDRALGDFGELLGSLDISECLRSDHSLDLPILRNSSCKVFLQSGGRSRFGVSDANFTMVAHRNGTILNSISGRECLRVDRLDNAVSWMSAINK